MVFSTSALGSINIKVGDQIRIHNREDLMTVYLVSSGIIGVSVAGKTNGHSLGGILLDRSGKFVSIDDLQNVVEHVVASCPIETVCPVCNTRIMSDEMIEDGRYAVCGHCHENAPRCTSCGTSMLDGAAFSDGEHSLCHHCRSEHVFECSSCYAETVETEGCLRNIRVAGYMSPRSFCSSCATRFHKCAECGKYMLGDSDYCPSCIRRLFVSCDCCGKLIRREQSIEARPLTGGLTYVCEDCSEGLTKCEDCGVLCIDTLTNPETGAKQCYACIVQQFVICTVCGTVEKRSPHNYNGVLCRNCRNLSRYGLANCRNGCGDNYMPNTCFNGYSYKPDLYMFPKVDVDNPIYYGIELEIDRENRSSRSDNWLSEHIVSRVPYAYVKHDGSLHYGAEIVTHPAHIDYHCDTMKQSWAGLFDFLKANDYSGHSAGTCGLHIHVSSKPLETMGKDVIEKLIFVWAKFWDNLVTFSRRDIDDDDQMDWAKPIYVRREILHGTTDDDDAMDELHELKDEERERYSAINLNNRNTIEFRLFRSTLHINTFCASLQLIDVAVKKCLASSFAELRKMTWEEFVQSDYAELNEYLASREKVRTSRYDNNWLEEDEDSPTAWCFDRDEDEEEDMEEEDSEDFSW